MFYDNDSLAVGVPTRIYPYFQGFYKQVTLHCIY